MNPMNPASMIQASLEMLAGTRRGGWPDMPPSTNTFTFKHYTPAKSEPQMPPTKRRRVSPQPGRNVFTVNNSVPLPQQKQPKQNGMERSSQSSGRMSESDMNYDTPATSA